MASPIKHLGLQALSIKFANPVLTEDYLEILNDCQEDLVEIVDKTYEISNPIFRQDLELLSQSIEGTYMDFSAKYLNEQYQSCSPELIDTIVSIRDYLEGYLDFINEKIISEGFSQLNFEDVEMAVNSKPVKPQKQCSQKSSPQSTPTFVFDETAAEPMFLERPEKSIIKNPPSISTVDRKQVKPQKQCSQKSSPQSTPTFVFDEIAAEPMFLERPEKSIIKNNSSVSIARVSSSTPTPPRQNQWTRLKGLR